MKHIRLLSIFTIALFFISLLSIGISANGLSNPMWVLTEGTQMVYHVDQINYGGNNFYPINQTSGSYNYSIGGISTGNLLFVKINYLPDVTNPSDFIVDLSLSATNTTEDWDHEYAYNVSDWPSEFNGPPFFMPVVTIPSNPADWPAIASQWNTAGFTANYDSVNNAFTLTGGPNTTLGVTTFTAKWNTLNGLMVYYYAQGTDHDTGVPYTMEMTFMYFKDESQWNMYWGVMLGDDFAFRWNVVNWGGNNYIQFDNSSGTDHDIYEGDLTVFEITNFAGPTDQGLFWNGSVTSPNWEDKYDFVFKKIGQSDGPMVWYPVMPLGNSEFYGNVSNEFKGAGADVTMSSTILNVTRNDGTTRQSATWDLSTGLMQTMVYNGEGPDQMHLDLQVDLIYHFQPNGQQIYTADHFDERYVVNDIANGTRDYLDFGENNGVPFRLYKNDILHINMYIDTYYDSKKDQLVTGWVWHGRTSSGYEITVPMKTSKPGLEAYVDGPSLLYFAVATSTTGLTSAQWWSEVYQVYTNLGFMVQNPPQIFGLTLFTDTFNFNAVWDKVTGVLNSYQAGGTDPNTGNNMLWQMSRSPYNIQSGSGLSWGVAAGTTMSYSFSDITTPVEFGNSNSSTTTISNGDVMEVKFVKLGDLQNQGPFVWVDMSINGVTQLNNSMGLKDPGFEFVTFPGDPESNGPPLLYFAIPTGGSSFWTTIEGMYTDAGYTVLNNATHFGVTVSTIANIQVIWQKSTGLMVYYHFEGIIDSNNIIFTARLIESNIVSSPTNNVTPGGFLPASNSIFFVLPVIAIVMLIIRRKKQSYNL